MFHILVIVAAIIWAIALAVLFVINLRTPATVAKWCMWVMWLCFWIIVALPLILARV